jgi:iron complex outermembrane receptor protein
MHEKLGPFEGALGFQSEKSNFFALGEEAFLPPVETLANSVFLFEEVAFDPFRVQLGVRYDHISVESSTAEGFGPGQSRDFDNVSASAGIIYTPVEGYAVALNAAFTQRAPTYQELFANGPHVATNASELGDSNLPVEKAFSLGLSLRKKTGRVTGAVSVFYNDFPDFIGQFATGEVIAGEEDDLPVYAYRGTRAEFFGGQIETNFHLLEPATEPPVAMGKDAKAVAPHSPARPVLDLTLKADYVRATDTRTGDPLPRIPPFRASAALDYRYERWNAGIEGQYAARQNRTSESELPTDHHFLLNASLGYHATLGRTEADVYVKGVNLTDSEARLHTSFLKDVAPLGGRGVVCGVKFTF